jgi:hypothetical protein
MARYVIKKWAEFQHYKDRCPPWIKLQRSLLDDRDFQCLPIASKALAPMLWLLASETKDGSIDGDPASIAWRLRWSVDEVISGLTHLIDGGFLVFDSDVLAACKQPATPEGEREGETEAEGETELPPTEVGKTAKRLCPVCPISEIIDLYHESLPTLPRMQVRNKTRDGYISSRWRQLYESGDFKTRDEGMETFRAFFANYVRPSSFLTGQCDGRNGGKPFIADLEWLMRPTNFAKVIEGKYANGSR